MPDSSTNARPTPDPEPCPTPAEMSEPDCTCSHITGDAYCQHHGGDGLEPDPSEPLDDQARNFAADRHDGPMFTYDATASPGHAPYGLTVSADGALINWRGENYVRQSDPDPGSTLYRQGWEAGYAAGHSAGHAAGVAETMRPIGPPPGTSPFPPETSPQPPDHTPPAY